MPKKIPLCPQGLVPTTARLRRFAVAIVAFAAALVPIGLPAEDAVVVGIANFPPLVMEADGSFEGFDIDIWNEIADEIGVDSTYVLMQFADLMEALKTGGNCSGLF